MPPKFNNARESAAPYNRAARRSSSARSAAPAVATPFISYSTVLKTPSSLRTVVSVPPTPPSPSPTSSTSTARASRKRRHDDEEESQAVQAQATPRVDSTPVSSPASLPAPKKRRSIEPASSSIVVAVEQQVVTDPRLSSSLPRKTMHDASSSLPTVASSPSSTAPSSSSSTTACLPANATFSSTASASPFAAPSPPSSAPSSPSTAALPSSASSSTSASSSSPSSPSREPAPPPSAVSTAPSSPVAPTTTSSPTPSEPSSQHLVSKAGLPPSVAPANLAPVSSAGPTTLADASVQTEAALELVHETDALRKELEAAHTKIIELEHERDQQEQNRIELHAELLASQASADLHRKNSEDLLAEGNTTFGRLRAELAQRTAERDAAYTKINELGAQLKQARADLLVTETGRLEDRQHAAKAFKALSEEHDEKVANMTTQHEADLKAQRDSAEKATKQISETHAQEIATLTAEHDHHVEHYRAQAEKAIQELKETHEQETANIKAKHQADVEEAKAYFTTMTHEREQLAQAKQAAENALEEDRKANFRAKEVLHGLAEAVKALDPPLPCTICASLLSNLDHLGSKCHIPSAACAVHAASAPRIHVPSGRNARLVEVDSDDEADASGSDDDDDMQASDSEDDFRSEFKAMSMPQLFLEKKKLADMAAARRAVRAERRRQNQAQGAGGDRDSEGSDEDDADVSDLEEYEDFFVLTNMGAFGFTSEEEVLDMFPAIVANAGEMVRVVPNVRFCYKDFELKMWVRPPRGMFERPRAINRDSQ